MIYSLKGTLVARGDHFLVIEAGGVGYKVFSNEGTIAAAPKEGSEARVFCHLHVREDLLDLYGFFDEGALKLFELLISVSGVGPRTALAILDLDTAPNLMVAIIEKRADLLSRAPGIGQKTAGRVVLELQNKITMPRGAERAKTIGLNMEVEEALVGLGYNRLEVRNVIKEVPNEKESLEEKLREALRMLGRNR